ncbi:MAG: alanine racemase [Methanococcaceae archaeon]
MRPTEAEINLSSLKFNYLNIRKKVKNSKVMAVVKADAYGHGMLQCVEALNALNEKKPDYYAVALLEEALELRKARIKQPILNFAPPLESEIKEFLKYKILPTVFEEQHIELLKQHSGNEKIKVHIKIDTGMGRLGVHYTKAFDFIEHISKEKKIIIDGIYTHFATSDENDKQFAQLQLSRFAEIVERLKNAGVDYGKAHCANSGAILDMPDSYFDMVRPGIALYGYYPSLETSASIKLKPVMSLISEVTNVKLLEPGDSVSYGRRFIAGKPTWIASVSAGYADGYARGLTNKAKILIKNKMYNQIGQVCMDRIMLESGEERLRPGQKVILLGRSGKNNFDAWEWAKLLNTIPYEITCNISKRVRRVYIN